MEYCWPYYGKPFVKFLSLPKSIPAPFDISPTLFQRNKQMSKDREATLTTLWNQLVDEVSERENQKPPMFAQSDVRVMCEAYFDAGRKFERERSLVMIRELRKALLKTTDHLAGAMRLSKFQVRELTRGLPCDPKGKHRDDWQNVF